MDQNKQTYRRMKHTIYSKGNPCNGTLALFTSELPQNILAHMDMLQNDPFLRSVLIKKAFPTNASEIENCGTMPLFYNLEQSLCWYTMSLCMQSDQINRFLETRNNMDLAFLMGNYKQCLDMVCQVNKNFGISLWEIKKRIAILSEKEGDEYQRAYADKIWTTMPKGSLCAYQIFHYSRQCESNISTDAYYNMLLSDYDRFL